MESYSVKAILSAKDAGFTAGMKAAQKSASGLEGKLKSGLGFGIMAGVGMKALGLVTNAMGGLSAATSRAVQRVDTLRNFEPMMKNLGFAANDSKKALDKMVKGIDGLPTSLDQIASSTTKIAPLTKSLSKATDITLAMNNALLAGGKAADRQNVALEQFSQMLSAGKVDMQSWRSMLDAMPAQLNQLAVSLLGAGKNQHDLYEAMKSGTVTFDDFNNALLKLNKKGLPGLASFEEQAKVSTKGIQTSIQNIRTAIVKGLANAIARVDEILAKGNFGTIAQNINKVKDRINKAFNELNSSPHFERFVRTTASGLKIIARNAGTIARLIGLFAGFKVLKLAGGYATVAYKGFRSLKTAMINIPELVRLSTAGYAGLAGQMGKTGAVISGMQNKITALNNVLKLTKPLTLSSVAGFGILAAGIGLAGYAIYKNIEANHKWERSVDSVIKKSDQRIKKAEESARTIDFYSDQLIELANKENRSAFDKQRLANLVDTLNSKVDGLNLKYDQEADKLNMSSQAIRDKCNAMKEAIKLSAMRENLESAYKTEYKMLQRLGKAQTDYALAKKKVAEYSGAKIASNAEYQQLQKNLSSTKTKLDDVSVAYANAQANTVLWEAQNLKSSGDIEGALTHLSEIASAKGVEIPTALAEGIKNGSIAIPTTLAEWNNLVELYGGTAANTAGTKGAQTGSNYKSNLASSGAGTFTAGLKMGADAVSGMASQVASAGTTGYNVGSTAKSNLESGSSGAYGIGSNFGSGFAKGISAHIRSAAISGRSIANAAIAAARHAGIVRSPSKVMKKIGRFYGEGFEIGLANTEKSISRQARDVATSAIAEFKNLSLPNPDLALSGNLNQSLSSDYSYSAFGDFTIEVPVNLDGERIAVVSAPYTEELLQKRTVRADRRKGRV